MRASAYAHKVHAGHLHFDVCSVDSAAGCPTLSAASEPFSVNSVEGGTTSLEPTVLPMHVELSRTTTTGTITQIESMTVEVRVDFGQYLDGYFLEASLASSP